MSITRVLMIALASLNAAWALSRFLEDYLRFVIQNFDPIRHSTPFDPAPLMAWLAVALASGLGAYVNLRLMLKTQRHTAHIIPAPAPALETQQEHDLAAA